MEIKSHKRKRTKFQQYNEEGNLICYCCKQYNQRVILIIPLHPQTGSEIIRIEDVRNVKENNILKEERLVEVRGTWIE